MRKAVRIVKNAINRIMPTKYSSKFDRLSEENQRTVASNYPRSGW